MSDVKMSDVFRLKSVIIYRIQKIVELYEAINNKVFPDVANQTSLHQTSDIKI